MEKPSKIELFFTGLFPKIILRNNIVATIIFNLGLKFKEVKNNIDNSLNTDI
jgi:hypothetical protein